MNNAQPQRSHLAYGDESENDDLVVYALALFRSERTDEARCALGRFKRRLGVPEETRLHSRIIFSGQRRRGTPWADVNAARLQDGIRTLLMDIGGIGETPEVGLVELRHMPPLPVAPGHPHREWRSKETMSLAAWATIVGATSRYGVDQVRFVIDGDRTKVRWGLGHKRADATRGLFIDVGQEREPVRIEPEIQECDKDVLLEVADVYAYTALRAHARQPARWFVEMSQLIQPNIRRIDMSSAPGLWVDASKRA